MSSKDLQRDFSGEYGVEGNDLGINCKACTVRIGVGGTWRSMLPDTHGWGWLQK